jgi:hypothetical protein
MTDKPDGTPKPSLPDAKPPPDTVTAALPEAAVPEPLAARPEPDPVPARKSQSQASARTVLTLLGLLLLFAGLAWVWTEQQDVTRRLAQATDRLDALDVQLRGLQQRAAVPAPRVDLGPLEQRLAAVEQRATAPAAVDLGPIEQRLATVENRPAPAPAPAPDPALPGRLEALEQAQKAGSARLARQAALQAAAAALQAGRPLGALPSAPPALARFAEAAPPREAALRAEFADATAAALAASRPPDTAGGVADRIGQKFRALVTVRDGDRVLVGPPAAIVLADAQVQLDAGNLEAAVAALDRLDPAAAAAMAEWRGRARSLLDARAALAGLMGAP